jgi:hypothetical protein
MAGASALKQMLLQLGTEIGVVFSCTEVWVWVWEFLSLVVGVDSCLSELLSLLNEILLRCSRKKAPLLYWKERVAIAANSRYSMLLSQNIVFKALYTVPNNDIFLPDSLHLLWNQCYCNTHMEERSSLKSY